MSNRQIFGLALVIGGMVSAGGNGLQFLKSLRSDAGLKVVTEPPVRVWVNDVDLGVAPIDKLFRPGEVKVRMGEEETKVRLNAKAYTVIRRDMATLEGDVVTLGPESRGKATLAVVSTSPDSAAVSMDGRLMGLTPLPVTEIVPGWHIFTISSPGFGVREVQANAVMGRRLDITAKLVPGDLVGGEVENDNNDYAPDGYREE